MFNFSFIYNIVNKLKNFINTLKVYLYDRYYSLVDSINFKIWAIEYRIDVIIAKISIMLEEFDTNWNEVNKHLLKYITKPLVIFITIVLLSLISLQHNYYIYIWLVILFFFLTKLLLLNYTKIDKLYEFTSFIRISLKKYIV